MDTTKAVSVQTGLPMVSIPTTYAGAEWTPFFGVRNEQTRTKDAGFDARVEGIVYEPELTLRMPPQVTAGTALNALTHCAEALYVPGRNDESDEHALQGAALIARHLPAVLDDGSGPRRRAPACSRARCTAAPRCASAWASGTRWPSRSAGATASRTAP